MKDTKSKNSNSKETKWTILGQDPDILRAMWSNIVSWFVSTYLPSYLPYLLPDNEYYEVNVKEERTTTTTSTTKDYGENRNNTQCISIGRPGGLEQLRLVTLKSKIVTKGYNFSGVDGSPFISIQDLEQLQQPNLESTSSSTSCIVILQNKAFSINYADCCIRWGLYESAKQFVGWPIVPGFDVAGIVQQVIPIHNNTTEYTDHDTTEQNIMSKSNDNDHHSKTTATTIHSTFQPGDVVFGCTLFGAYSNTIAIPAEQLRPIPNNMSFAQAASLPAVSLTALYALYLSGHYVIIPNNTNTTPQTTQTTTNTTPSSSSSSSSSSFHTNRGILIHSAAGGVGSMAIQMAKVLNLYPIVGIVGRTHKVEAAKALGCHHVISKQEYNNNKKTNDTTDWWDAVAKISPSGYSTILDPNGAATLQQSYQHLCPTGRLIVYGFHSNLPLGQASLNPWTWIQMGQTMQRMPSFDPMDMVVSNKSVLGFNLSFFAQETKLVALLFQQVCEWLEQNVIQCPRIVELEMNRIQEAHELIQSGQSIGKIVMSTTTTTSNDST